MSAREVAAADVGGPITGRTGRLTLAGVTTIDLSEWGDGWITLLPGADMRILLAPTKAEADLVDDALTVLDGDGVPTFAATTGVLVTAGSRVDFRIPFRLGTRGEAFLGMSGAGDVDFWLSSNIT